GLREVAIVYFVPRSAFNGQAPPADAARLLADMVKGDRQAVDRARRAIDADAGLLAPLSQGALEQESPYARAAGCELLFDRGAEWLPLLIPGVSGAGGVVAV